MARGSASEREAKSRNMEFVPSETKRRSEVESSSDKKDTTSAMRTILLTFGRRGEGMRFDPSDCIPPSDISLVVLEIDRAASPD